MITIIMIMRQEKVIIKVKVVAMSEPKKNVLYAFYCDVLYGANGEKKANHGKKRNNSQYNRSFYTMV